MWRTEFVVGKFLGVVALAAAFCGLLTVLLAAVLWWREGQLMEEFSENFAQGRAVSYGLLALAGFMQWLKLAVLAAFALLVASFAQTQLFTVVTGFFILVICHLQYLAQDAYAGVAGRMLSGVISSIFRTSRFALAESLSAAAPARTDRARRGHALGYIAVVCALTVFSFRQREI